MFTQSTLRADHGIKIQINTKSTACVPVMMAAFRTAYRSSTRNVRTDENKMRLTIIQIANCINTYVSSNLNNENAVSRHKKENEKTKETIHTS